MADYEPVVSDLVIDVIAASGEAVGKHLNNLIRLFPGIENCRLLAQALDHGYSVDLDDYVDQKQEVGFDHLEINNVFRQRIRKHAKAKKEDQASKADPIWSADEDHGVFSLFGRPPSENLLAKYPLMLKQRRTRVSSIVQHSMKDARSFRQAEKATRSDKSSTFTTIPSPLNLAGQILADPHNVSSQVYAKTALLEWVREALEVNSDKSIDTSFDGISTALEVINNRRNTSKPIASNTSNPGITAVFLCNLFAIHGFMAMRIDLAELSKSDDLNEFYNGVILGRPNVAAEFIVNPHFTELPSIAEVMNLIDGIPIGLEGAESIFQGGIRLSPEKSVVAAVSGTFGAGKTLLSLSLAAALAPLGCRTLFLSFEEKAADISARMGEIAPPGIERAALFYREISEQAKTVGFSQQDWFLARHVQLDHVKPGEKKKNIIDPASALRKMLRDTLKNATFFRPWNSQNTKKLPLFARPVIVVDGLHQLFDIPHERVIIEPSLRDLVDQCRELGAIFIFSFSKEAEGLKRLEYLCDLIIELDREGFEDPAESPRRYFQLLKARRQPARIGAHVFHLHGGNGFRLKPSSDARLQEAKRELWWDPDNDAKIFLTDDVPSNFIGGSSGPESSPATNMAVRNWGQVLVIGKGSSGKAGFGLYLLHRRWFDTDFFNSEIEENQLGLLDDDLPRNINTQDWSARETAIVNSGLPIWHVPPYLETRVLVVSFLYQSSYYDVLTARLLRKRIGKAKRVGVNLGNVDQMHGAEYAPLPDKMKTDTIELYPGMLGPEDFIAKIEKKLTEAEAMGLPYTGVLVDGLHNVFVQFPKLEQSSSFWGTFYNILRRRRVTVVTTHTEFSLQANLGDDSLASNESRPLIYNFEQAQQKVAPLLSALISGADYLFELSPKQEGTRIVYKAIPRGSIGQDVGNFGYNWDKAHLKLEGTRGPSNMQKTATLSQKELSNAIVKSLAQIVKSSI